MKIKIAFYIESMVVGGAEKVLIDLVNNLDISRFDISVIAIFKKSVYSDYEFQFNQTFASHIRYHWLVDNSNPLKYKAFNFLYNKLPKSWLYRALNKEKYDIEVAFYEGMPTDFVAHSIQKSKKIAWLHTHQEHLYNSISIERKKYLKYIYEKYDRIIGVSNSVCKSFDEIFPTLKTTTIYNPFQVELIRRNALDDIWYRFNKNTVNLITVGRLIKIKGYERLIESLKKCKENGFFFTLCLIGQGEDKNYLNKLVHEYKLENEIYFLGHIENPYPYIKQADCLICSSYLEGLSTVVIESLILGTPVITTNCGGMDEIFGEVNCGIICENSEDGIYKAIKDILENPSVLQEFNKNITSRGDFFSIENRISQLDEIIDVI